MDIQDAAWEVRPHNQAPPCTRASRLATTEGGGWTMEVLLGSNGQMYRHTVYTDGRTPSETWERLAGVRL